MQFCRLARRRTTCLNFRRMEIEDIALTMTPALGVRGVVHLLNLFGNARAVFAASEQELVRRAELRPDVARNIASRKGMRQAERELEYCRRNGVLPVASTDEAYPALLREIDDYPHVIYVRGSVEALSLRAISFVGTRRMTPYGERMCMQLVEGLARLVPGLCIVSGLAFGIDSAAHRAALAHGVATVAVVANALPDVTPAQHAPLARDIVEHGGAIVSELPSCTKQNGSYYIPRNRIIAGLGCGTVIVESHAGGGALSTVRFADGYNRSVMAVPGRATDSASVGTNMLIRNRKAQLVLSAEDVVGELAWDLDPALPCDDTNAVSDISPDDARILDLFVTPEPLSFEELLARASITAGELTARLIVLELAGAVCQLPGKRYQKTV